MKSLGGVATTGDDPPDDPDATADGTGTEIGPALKTTGAGDTVVQADRPSVSNAATASRREPEFAPAQIMPAL